MCTDEIFQYTHYCECYCYYYAADDDGDDDKEGIASGGKEYSVSYEGNDQLRHKVMEPG